VVRGSATLLSILARRGRLEAEARVGNGSASAAVDQLREPLAGEPLVQKPDLALIPGGQLKQELDARLTPAA
jgi:hypothetical protein